MTPTERCNVMRECIKMAKDVHGNDAEAKVLIETAKYFYDLIIKEK